MISSGVRPPNAGPMRILNTSAVLAPTLRISPETELSSPARIDPTLMMVPVPIITPSTVRNERSLFSRNASSARRITESRSFISVLRPHGDDGIESRRLPRGVDAEEQADHGGQTHSQQHGVRGDFHGHRRERAHQARRGPCDADAEEPSGEGQNGGLEQ